MQKRAPGTPAASSGYRLDNTPTYFADVWAENKPIPDQLRGNADAVLNIDRDAAEFLSQQALIRREKLFAGNPFWAGKWGTDLTGVAAGPATGQLLQWNGPASNPIVDDVVPSGAALRGRLTFSMAGRRSPSTLRRSGPCTRCS